MNIGNYIASNMMGSHNITLQSHSNEKVVDLEYIITKKPSIKIVRGFMEANLANIKSEEESLFPRVADKDKTKKGKA